MKLRKYNPALLSDAQLIEQFVARNNDLEILLKTVRENIGRSSNQHIMFIGQRGMGKTTLVLRAMAEVRRDKTLSDAWFPVVMAEESYMVGSAAEFWLEAVLRLAENLKDPALEKTHALLLEETDNKILYEKALGVLLDFADKLGKRLIVVAESFNMLFGEQIHDDEGWILRETLISEPRIMLVATATSRFDQIDNIRQPMFELFAVRELSPLSLADCGRIWALVTGDELDEHRVRPVEILTGGNPRLLVILSSFAAKSSLKELIEDLIALIDDHTDYLKSNTESLPPLERKAFVALADIWAPAAAKDVAKAARMNVNQASTQLTRLVKRGAVVVQRKEGRKKYYQLAERLYNIYHQLRRRGSQSNRVRTAVKFMIDYYEERELRSMVESISKECLGLSPEQRQVHLMALEELIRNCNRLIGSIPEQLRECPDFPSILKNLHQAIISVESIPLEPDLDLEIEKRHRTYLAPIAESIRNSPDVIEPVLAKVHDNMGMKDTLLFKLATIYFDSDSAEKKQPIGDTGGEGDNKTFYVWLKLINELNENTQFAAAEVAAGKAVELAPENGLAWLGLGNALLYQKKYEEAEKAFQKAVSYNPELAAAYNGIGNTLIVKKGLRFVSAQINLGGKQLLNDRIEKAEKNFRKAIELHPDYADAWNGLGLALQHQKRFEEAERACRKAIDLSPNFVQAWNVLGIVNQNRKDYANAEKAYLKAIELDNNCSYAWNNLCLMSIDQEKYSEAEKICRERLNARNESDIDRFILGIPSFHLGLFDESMDIFQKILKKECHSVCFNNIGYIFLAQGKAEKAKDCFMKAVRLDRENTPLYIANLGLALIDVGEPDESLSFFIKSLNLISEQMSWPSELNSLARLCMKLQCEEQYPNMEEWIRLARRESPGISEYALTHAGILAAMESWEQALDPIAVFLKNPGFVRHFIPTVVDFFIGATVAGFARESLEILSGSPSAIHFEPLIVALQKYLRIQTNAPLEIYEVAKDIVAEIEQRRN